LYYHRHLQSHHTGIEIWLSSAPKTSPWSFNRTILELKFDKYSITFCWDSPFNRTILELKYDHEWLNIFCFDAFNRTILELKYVHRCNRKGTIMILQSHHTGIEILDHTGWCNRYISLQSHHTGIEITKRRWTSCRKRTFNRTILELKWMRDSQTRFSTHAFNRTILELKYRIWIFLIPYRFLQSHHTGIEIRDEEFMEVKRQNLQSHHTGIEITRMR